MESKCQQPVTLGMAVIMVFTALYGYRGRSGSLHELTFLSNFLSGVFLSLTFFFRRSEKGTADFVFRLYDAVIPGPDCLCGIYRGI